MAEEAGFVVTGGGTGGLERLDEIILEAIAKAALEAGEFLAGRAKENAPIDKGPLRASIEARAVSTGQTTEILLVAAEDYALRMHEQLTPFGPLNLGPGSQAAAASPVAEGGPGGKFLARAVDFNIKKVQKDIGDALQEHISVEVSSNRPGFRPGAFFPPARFEGA